MYSPEIAGSTIPVMTVAAPSEVLVHGGISKVFPSISTIATRRKRVSRRKCQEIFIELTSGLLPFGNLVQEFGWAVSLQTGLNSLIFQLAWLRKRN
jgi:hypothetical protein